MKQLLKLLTILTLVGTTGLNVVACGSTSSRKGSDSDSVIDTAALIKEAKANISTAFANLISANKNLVYDVNFPDGAKLLKRVDTLATNKDITDQTTFNAFFDLTTNNITDSIVPYLLSQKDTTPLFNSLPANQILTIDRTKTTLTKTDFKWKKVDGVNFGINQYDEKNYNITAWFKLTINLKLLLTYHDNGETATTEVDQSFSYQFANDGAKIQEINTLTNRNIQGRLKNTILNLDLQAKKTNLAWNEQEPFTNIGDIILVDKLNSDKTSRQVAINTTSIANYHDLQHEYGPEDAYDFGANYLRNDGKKLTIATFTQNMITGLQKTQTQWETSFNEWTKDKPTITSPEKVFIYGDYIIKDWTYQGINLRPYILPFVASRNITRTKEAENAAAITAKLWCLNDGALKNGTHYKMGGMDFGFKMNPKDYDEYLIGNNTFFDTLTYGANKITSLAKAKKILQASDKIDFYSTDYYQKPSNNWTLNKGLNDSYGSSHQVSGWPYMVFSINGYLLNLSNSYSSPMLHQRVYKADKDIWPND